MDTPMVNFSLNWILVGTLLSVGLATDMKGGFKNCTRNSLHVIYSIHYLYVPAYRKMAHVWNSVPFTTWAFGFEPAIMMFLNRGSTPHQKKGKKKDYPDGVKVAVE